MAIGIVADPTQRRRQLGADRCHVDVRTRDVDATITDDPDMVFVSLACACEPAPGRSTKETLNKSLNKSL